MIEPKKLVLLGFLEEGKVGCIEKVELLPRRTFSDFERVEFWDHPDKDIIRYHTIEEFVEDILECFPLHGCQGRPSSVLVHGYARMEISLAAGSTLERVLEWLDEEYGDPDGSDNTEPTEEMIEAEKELHNAILRGYHSWACERVVEVVVNLTRWKGDP